MILCHDIYYNFMSWIYFPSDWVWQQRFLLNILDLNPWKLCSPKFMFFQYFVSVNIKVQLKSTSSAYSVFTCISGTYFLLTNHWTFVWAIIFSFEDVCFWHKTMVNHRFLSSYRRPIQVCEVAKCTSNEYSLDMQAIFNSNIPEYLDNLNNGLIY